jgi:capsular polysaccharide biosynthesis protein
VILLMAAILAGAAWLTSTEPSPTYASTSQLVAANQVRVATFAQFAKTDAVLQPAAAKANVGISSQELAHLVSTQVTSNSAVFSLTVTTSSPELAQILAAAVTDSLLTEIRDFEAAAGVVVEPVRLLQPASPAEQITSGDSRSTRVAAAAVGGLIVGFALAWLRFLVGLPVRDEKEAADYAGSPVIGSVGGSKPSGPEELSIVDVARFQWDLRFLSAGGRRRYAVVDAVWDRNPEAVAIALAHALATSGNRVVLLGVDPDSCGLSERLEQPGSPGLSDVLAGLAPIGEAARRWNDDSLWILPAGSRAPNTAELLALPASHKLIDEFGREFDFVLAVGPSLMFPATDSPFDASLLVVRLGDATDYEVSRSAAELSLGSPVVGVITRDHASRGPGAWWSRVRRRIARGKTRVLTRASLAPRRASAASLAQDAHRGVQ